MEQSFGQLINQLRNEKGLTLKELADQADMTYVEICNIENNKHKPRPSTINKLAKALGYSYNKLYNASQKYKGE